ncbi:MAG TPA: hypothetical protein VGD98_08865 [Ktedonobacteraceae bacterium]
MLYLKQPFKDAWKRELEAGDASEAYSQMEEAREDAWYAAAAQRAYASPAGTIYLRDHCPAAFVEQLRADAGLRAFAHTPQREHALLLALARSESGELTLAYTARGLIVGQITFAEAGEWWSEAGVCREVAIEVSASWRKRGVARHLIELVATREDLENWILLAQGFSWHWETEQLGLPVMRYRAMLARLAISYGFVEYLTSEPNISETPANILLGRLGSKVDQQALERFYTCLLRSETLPGL